MLDIKELRCHEAKIEESEKVTLISPHNPVKVSGVRLSWLSGRALAAKARGILGLTPSNYQPVHYFRLITPKSLYFQCEARCALSSLSCHKYCH